MPFVQRNTDGFVVGRFANAQPGLAEEWLDDDAPALSVVSPAQLATAERAWRDGELSAVKWLRERHRDQLDIEISTTLSDEQFLDLLRYVQGLRDWPQSPDFPVVEHRPIAPVWIASQTQ
jgi:hypothetical protein